MTWGFVVNKKEYSYIEYSFVNPIKIKVISASDFMNPKDKLHSIYNLFKVYDPSLYKINKTE